MCFEPSAATTACVSSGGVPSLELLIHGLQNTDVAVLKNQIAELIDALHTMKHAATRHGRMVALAHTFVCTFACLFRLYISDRPIDPSVSTALSRQSLQHQIQSLQAQLELHEDLEHRMSGNQDNEVISYLQNKLRDYESDLDSQPTLPLRSGTARLHMFWSEVHQFENQIIKSAALLEMVSLLKEGDHAVRVQEQMVQQSVLGFCQRLESVYQELADISAPLIFALLHLRIGLHLARWSWTDVSQPHTTQFCSNLVSFPTVSAATYDVGPGTPPLQGLLLSLSQTAFEHSIGVGLEAGKVDAYLEKALHLWRAEQAKKAEAELSSQSIYRSKIIQSESVDDSKREEEELRALFPTYEEEDNRQPVISSNTASTFGLSDMSDLVEIHRICFGPSAFASGGARLTLNSIRQRLLSKTVESSFSILPDTLDTSSRNWQLSLLHKRLRVLQIASPESTYNFYVDPNVGESKRASALLERLLRRLIELIDEWPDQMVLQHLRTRCEAALMLDSLSPLAKILATLEQLLSHSDDWEIYANKQNSLVAYRNDIIAIIINWRRLELASWNGLLASEEKMFMQGANNLWFEIYDAVVQTPARYSELDICSYFDTLIPLLDDFIRTSPLGQYETRMTLLKSLQRHCQSLGLSSIQNMLRSTVAYFSMFSAQIESQLTQQRRSLEKEIRDYIKIASWKDVNVHALKQSAKRTHHHLYKIIRKYRDILRQPITGLLVYRGDESSDSRKLVYPRLPWAESISVPPAQMMEPDARRSMPETFQRYQTIIATQLRNTVDESPCAFADNLSLQIISITEDLASQNIPDSDRREKFVKSLQSRKRKAWSDMLKELKRIGVQANVKANILERQQHARWWRNQPNLPELDFANDLWAKAERYFVRLSALVFDLRARISSHHHDIQTRDLNRSIMFTESACAFAIDSRAR
jgi:midasin